MRSHHHVRKKVDAKKQRTNPHSPKLQHYWNLIIRLFSVIIKTLVGGVLPLFRDAVGVFFGPNQLGYPTTKLYSKKHQ